MQRLKENQALSADEFQGLMAPYEKTIAGEKTAVAVSGGPDSTALAALLKNWCEQKKYAAPLALIIDHGLRENSREEAALTQDRLKQIGLPAEILRWQHEPISSSLHAEARKARYDLLTEACKQHGILNLFLAHQREDQAETVLMRLAKGTGIDGLAGMAAMSELDGVKILRPLLPLPKERLIATCEAARLDYVKDPSNELDKFARGRLRRVMPLLAEEGLTVDRLVDFAARAGEAKQALDFYTAEFFEKHGRRDEWGLIAIDKAPLLSLPRAIALRALGDALLAMNTEPYPPQHASLSLVLNELEKPGEFASRTLNGCFISESGGEIKIIREIAAITETSELAAGGQIIWDGRWELTATHALGSGIYHVKPVGNPPHELLDRLSPGLRHKVPQGKLRATLPSLWIKDEISLIPFFDPEDRIKVRFVQRTAKKL